MTNETKPSAAVFAGGGKDDRVLAIHPEAIGATFKVKAAKDVWNAELTPSGVAVLCIEGPLEHKGGTWSWWESYEQIARDFVSLLADASVSAIVLKFDSPGGEVSGLTETVRMMQAAKASSGKRVIAYVDEDCYSAAYALAMVADEIYLPDAGGVGSIGVITALIDCTENDKANGLRWEVIASGAKKTDGHPHVPISAGAIKRTQRRVNALADQFFALVSDGRGLSVDAIAGLQAGVYAGAEAVTIGLADGVMSLRECLTLAADLFSSPKDRADDTAPKEIDTMTAPLAAARALNEAQAALAAATTDKDRARLAAAVQTAETAFTAAMAGASVAPAKPAAKVKKTKTTTTDTHEEVVDDGEPDDEDDEDDEDSEPGSASDADAEEAGDDAVTGLHTKDRLLRLARQITGKRSIEEVMGALHALDKSNRSHAVLAAKVARLEGEANGAKLDAMIARGMTAGQLAPSQRAWARTQTVAGLRAYLETAPKMVHTVDDAATEQKTTGREHGTVTPEMARIWRKLGFAEKDFPSLLAKLNNGAVGANGAS